MRIKTPERVPAIFVEFADTLIEEFEVVEFFKMVATRTAELVAYSHSGVLIADERNDLQFMAASDGCTQSLELFQVQSHQGPGRDCFLRGVSVVNSDLQTANDRWPRFAPLAVAAGFRSVHAFPMRLRSEVIGSMSIFSADVGQLDPVDVRVIQSLVDVAMIGLLKKRAIARGEVETEQLQDELNRRIIIEQAKGVLAQIHGCGVDEAFNLLRSYCRDHNLLLSSVAKAVVTDPAEYPVLTATRFRTSA
ncbi:MAG: GAF and ANTAR domain-containing protein [Actinomycetota bacterium]|nr:GAF and ANTAR domain-containing protein [Actinomycetota bacterium]